MTHKLSDYKLTYNVTQMPLIIYASMTNILEPLDFEGFRLPSQCKTRAAECRFAIYKPNGDLYEMVEKLVPTSHDYIIIHTLHTIPQVMINNLLKTLQDTNAASPY